jgi:hypothetical protein
MSNERGPPTVDDFDATAMHNARSLSMVCPVHITFFVMVHQSPFDKFARLLKRLASHPCHTTIVHVDSRSPDGDIDEVASLVALHPNVFHARARARGYWGGVSLVRIELLGIMEALERNPTTDFIINLSSDDYPIKPMEHIHEFLRRYKSTSFVHISKAVGVATRPRKHEKFFLECANYPVRVLPPNSTVDGSESDLAVTDLYARVLNSTDRIDLTHRAMLRNYGAVPSYGLGSQWWMLSNEAAFHIVGSHSVRAHYHMYKHLHIPDESFFQSLFLSDPILVGTYTPNNMRLAYLTRGRCSSLDDTNITLLSTSSHLFARKFKDVATLDIVDQMVLYKWQYERTWEEG